MNDEFLISELKNHLSKNEFSKSIIFINIIESRIIKNICFDEICFEKKIETHFVKSNEILKKAIVNANLIIFKNNKNIKVYLDDKRKTPKGYIRAFWPEDVVSYIENDFDISEISLDHDLGDDERGTGYDVVCYIEEKVYLSNYKAPFITVHSDNLSAKLKMNNGIKNIVLNS